MLTKIYIEALLVDEELADQVWEAWDVGEINDQLTSLRVMEQKLKAADIHDAKLWIEHGRYDGMGYPNHRKKMNNWELPPD